MTPLERWNPFRATEWEPLRELRDIENRMARIFGRTPLLTNSGKGESIDIANWAPLVDITEDEKEYLLKAELPEVKKEDVKVTIQDDVLSVTGERKFEKEEKGKKYHRVERAYGNFERTFTLPEGADASKVSAEFKDGVLKVHLPKGEKAKPKAVEVKVG